MLKRLLVSAPDVKTGGSNWACAALTQQAATAMAMVLLRKDMSGIAPDLGDVVRLCCIRTATDPPYEGERPAALKAT